MCKVKKFEIVFSFNDLYKLYVLVHVSIYI